MMFSKSMHSLCGAIAAFIILLPVSTSVGAPNVVGGGLSLPALEREIGINAAGFLFLPVLTFTGEYNTNLFYANDSDVNPPASGFMMVVSPELSLSTPKNQVLSVDASGRLGFRNYFADTKASDDLSKISGDVKFRGTFLKNGPVVVSVFENFSRLLERRNEEVASGWDRHLNKAGADINIVPGGKALSFRLGYSYFTDYFQDTMNDWGDVQFHDIVGRFSWKFFPVTAFVVEANWQIRDYLDNTGGKYGELTDCAPLKARVGMTGFLTKAISVGAFVGWGNSFHDSRKTQLTTDELAKILHPGGDNTSYNSFLAEARISFQFPSNTIAQISYKHDFEDSLFANYVVADKVGVNLQQRVASKFDFYLNGEYKFLSYSVLPPEFAVNESSIISSFGGYERSDSVIGLGLGGEFDIMRYLKVSVGYSMEADITDFKVVYRDGGINEMGYIDHRINANLILRY